jgi:hypothetical protein
MLFRKIVKIYNFGVLNLGMIKKILFFSFLLCNHLNDCSSIAIAKQFESNPGSAVMHLNRALVSEQSESLESMQQRFLFYFA